MDAFAPTIEHVYQNHAFDSPRWERYSPRDDDIVVASSIKSGTTWMQAIVLQLIFQDFEQHDIGALSPWLDFRWRPADAVFEMLEAQTHRRCIKTHLPLDGLPYFPQIKYVLVGRAARDVFMSLWNHQSNLSPQLIEVLNSGQVGDPLPPTPSDIKVFWRNWITRGWFPWESEGYPNWGNLRHTQTWWNYRHLPNVLFVHYNDMLADLSGEIGRVAQFLEIKASGEALSAIASVVDFKSMKANAESIAPGAQDAFIGGAQTFFHKGTNNRWREILNEDDLELYTAAVARELTPDCAAWLENGRLALEPKRHGRTSTGRSLPG
jgi:aryl sulfotransferase